MRRGPHKGSRGRRERFTFPETQGPCPGAAPTALPVESDLPGLPHEPQLLQEFELVVVDVALRNLASFHFVHNAPSKLDSILGGRDDAVTLRPKQRRSKPWRSGPLCVPVMRSSTQTQSPCPKPRTRVHERSGKASPQAWSRSWTASRPFTGSGKSGLDMTILSTWRPHRWSQFRSLIASKAASTM